MTTSLVIIALYVVLVWALERGHRQPGRSRWIDRDLVGNAARDDARLMGQTTTRGR